MNKTQLLEHARELFGGKPYIVTAGAVDKTKFLVLADAKVSDGEWFKNGEPQRFEYTCRQCVASGKTWNAVWKSALIYHKLETLPKDEAWLLLFKTKGVKITDELREMVKGACKLAKRRKRSKPSGGIPMSANQWRGMATLLKGNRGPNDALSRATRSMLDVLSCATGPQ